VEVLITQFLSFLKTPLLVGMAIVIGYLIIVIKQKDDKIQEKENIIISKDNLIEAIHKAKDECVKTLHEDMVDSTAVLARLTTLIEQLILKGGKK
jgi:hypothetical protein